jgi:sugar lactone lactonase YvrE
LLYHRTYIDGFVGSLGTSNNAFLYPSDIVSDPSTFYITDTSNNRVMYYSFKASVGTIVTDGNGARPNNTQLNLPIGIYFDAVSNSLFIANFGGHTVVRWVLADNHWTLVAGNINETNGSSSVLLNGPVGITLDPMGNIYVTDSNTDHVQLFLASQSTGATGIVGSNATLLTNP